MASRIRVAASLVLLIVFALSCAPLEGPSPIATAPAAATAVSPATALPASPVPTAAPPSPTNPAASPTQMPPPPDPAPLSPTGSPAPAPTPAATAAPRPVVAPAPTVSRKNCSNDPVPESLAYFGPAPETILQGGVQYYLLGRGLSVNEVPVDWQGTDAGSDLVTVRSEGCMVNLEVEYDWIYIEYYASNCPKGLADIPSPESGPWNVYVVGRAFYVNGILTESEGLVNDYTTEDSWKCQGIDYRSIVYWSAGNATPEASTLLLLGSGLTALAGWIVWQRRRRAAERRS